jgi:hypothetical protein
VKVVLVLSAITDSTQTQEPRTKRSGGQNAIFQLFDTGIQPTLSIEDGIMLPRDVIQFPEGAVAMLLARA